MASWHQRRARTPLYHTTQWALVRDPPGEMASSMLYETEADANAALALWKANGRSAHCYVLPPTRKGN